MEDLATRVAASTPAAVLLDTPAIAVRKVRAESGIFSVFVVS